jgi:16S rRNA (cytosine967-C5)-methyltransferase
VLIDAPCTSSGTWRRNPDLRWRHHGPSQAEIIQLQTKILDKFTKCVKPGGRLIYATCSLFREENEDQVVAFLAKNPEFTLVPIDDVWAQAELGGKCPYKGDVMRLSPKQSGTDGFFAAVLERAKPEVEETPVTEED